MILPDIKATGINVGVDINVGKGDFQWIKISPKIEEVVEENVFAPDVKFNDPSLELEPTKIVNLSALMFDSLTGLRDEPNYYMHIANNGYTYESCLAFMPMYPLAIRSIADCIQKLYNGNEAWVNANLITFPTLLLLCAQFVNVISFAIAADG